MPVKLRTCDKDCRARRLGQSRLDGSIIGAAEANVTGRGITRNANSELPTRVRFFFGVDDRKIGAGSFATRYNGAPVLAA
jgi:hypothetical protein